MSEMFLNFLEIELSKEEFEIKACNYENKSWYDNLKKNYNQYSFLKDANNSLVYIWPKDFCSIVYLGNVKVFNAKVSINNNANLISRILEDRVNYLFNNDNYHHFHEKYSSSNIIINNKQLFAGNKDLLINRCVSFNVSFVSIDNKIKFYIVLNTFLKKKFNINEKEAKEKGFNVEEKWIKNNKIIPNEKAILRYLQNFGLEYKYNNIIKKETCNEETYKVIYKTLNYIKIHLENNEVLDFKIRFSNLTNLPYRNNFFNCEYFLTPKRYYFDDKAQIDNRYYDNNLKILKPHSYSWLNKKISIAVICPMYMKGSTEEFLLKLKLQLKELMYIPDVEFDINETESDKLFDYKKVVDGKINDFTKSSVDLVIVIVTENMKMLPINNSPYYYCKAKFLGRGISTQEIRIESIRHINQHILNNITLNIYAKIGGTPWTIETIDGIKEEYIIGISSSVDFEKNKVIGYANVFDYTGTYCVGDTTSICDGDSYYESFKEVIKNQVKKILDSGKKKLRLIFHLFKSPANDTEIAALKEMIEEFKEIDIDYCFVKVSYYHNYRIFDNEGKNNVKSGRCIYISQNQALITFTKNIPAHIVIDKRSTFKDLYYICKQLYYFSHLSVRGFKPSYKPVTILYPRLMMNLLVKLKEIPSWDLDSIKSIGDKLWFV